MAEKREEVRESRSFPAVMTLQTTDVLHYSISKFTTVTTEKERRSGSRISSRKSQLDEQSLSSCTSATTGRNVNPERTSADRGYW